ncbi:hypothetical protein [Shimia aestuarii]|uniref:hypothetical protein n=1 Tax=Shimia aestuarii TaxID=254406 RepID=UPI001FB4E00A|nr:hypothetical protein [Shimia aestuarii]
MTDSTEAIRSKFDAAEDIAPDASVGEDDGPDMIDDGDDGGAGSDSADTGLPRGFPVQPLGMSGGKFRFLTARGELAELTAGALAQRSSLVSLLAGCKDPLEHLGELAPPASRRDQDFNPAKAADRLMQACSVLPLYDPSTSMRHFGTWKGATDTPVVHLGERVLHSDEEDARGRMISRALYPAVPSRAVPSNEKACAADLGWVRDRLFRFWSWGSDIDADVLMGWVGQAALGQYPVWRTHMYVRGRPGSGKTTLTHIVSSLLGGMSTGVKNSSSAAAIRQTTNRMAIARIFDEAEADESGAVSDVIALFRLMSDQVGAQVERGTSDHSGVRFELYGAGFLASVIPAPMTSADRTRFIVLKLGKRGEVDNPGDQAARLEELQCDAEELGAKIWRRMIDLAPSRWARTFRVYNSLVQSLGAPPRVGDTVGAVLAGWDLMLFEDPLIHPDTGCADVDRMERATAIARPLVDKAREADEESEGERCLRMIFSAILHKDHGGIITAAEIIERMQEGGSDSDVYDNRLLGRLGIRLLDGARGRHEMFIANGQNSLLDRALSGSSWRAGGHRAALDTLDGVVASPKPVRVQGRPRRGLIIPARFLPGAESEPEGARREGDDI